MKSSRIASGFLLVFYPALLVGCGMFDYEEREPWRAQAEAACYARHLVKLTPFIQQSAAIEGKGICGIDRPLRVSALEDGSISLGSRALVLSCPMTAALEAWVRNSVMPAALARYGSPVVEIRNFGTYNCRGRNNIPGARLSEHAFANAFDFAGARLANGYVVTVKQGWYGSVSDRAFLREITAGACGPFNTVLGPGSDAQHGNHLHLDLAHHNARGTYRYCKPRPDVPAPTAPVYQADAGVPFIGSQPAPVWPGGAAPAYPMSSANPGVVSRTGSSGFDQQLPPATVPNAPAGTASGQYRTIPTAPAGVVQPVRAQPAQPAGCPPGYICTPVDANSAAANITPDALGWSVGPQPHAGYAADDITGSIGGYSDD